MRNRPSMTIVGIFGLLVVGGMALGMTALLGLGLKNIWRGITSVGWPSTPATVAKVEMTKATSRDTRRQTSTTTYRAALTFRYTVNGKEYETDQVRWGQTIGSGDAAEAVVLALSYPEGRVVSVHYDSGKPEDAVVKPGLTGSAFLLPGAALVFLLFLVPACVMMWGQFVRPPAGDAPPMPDMGGFIRMFLVIPVLMGSPMVVQGVRNLMAAERSRTWPKANGAWLRDLATNQVPGLEAVREHPGFDYVYQYTAKGEVRYQCARWFGQGSSTGNNSDAEIETEFPRGQPLVVYYDPADPDTAVLSTGLRGFAWILPGAGLGFIAFGVLGMILVARRG